jgi:tryptophanyl-tRNA synthetase
MSKSRKNAIFLTMSADEVDDAIKRAKTDSARDIKYDAIRRPEISSLLQIFSLCTGLDISQVVDLFDGKGYADLKRELSEAVNTHLDPIRLERRRLEKQAGLVTEVLCTGLAKARDVAAKTLDELRCAMHMSFAEYVGTL